MKLPTFLFLLGAAAHAAPRTSASYNVPTESADAGGRRTTRGRVTQQAVTQTIHCPLRPVSLFSAP